MPEVEPLPDERTRILLERLPGERTRMFLLGAVVGIFVGGFFATVFVALVFVVLSLLGYIEITV
jgi:hypothetical protein